MRSFVLARPRSHPASLEAEGSRRYVTKDLLHSGNKVTDVPLGLVEFRLFLSMYALSLIFQILTTGSFLRQTSTALVVLTAIHMGLIAALGWALVANGLVSMQWVEDGTISSLAVSRLTILPRGSANLLPTSAILGPYNCFLCCNALHFPGYCFRVDQRIRAFKSPYRSEEHTSICSDLHLAGSVRRLLFSHTSTIRPNLRLLELPSYT